MSSAAVKFQGKGEPTPCSFCGDTTVEVPLFTPDTPGGPFICLQCVKWYHSFATDSGLEEVVEEALDEAERLQQN